MLAILQRAFPGSVFGTLLFLYPSTNVAKIATPHPPTTGDLLLAWGSEKPQPGLFRGAVTTPLTGQRD